jgi:DNA-binding PadR family transcriptional regulator
MPWAGSPQRPVVEVSWGPAAEGNRGGPSRRSHNGPVSDVRLTPISYVVLGLLEVMGPSTPYDIKKAAEGSIGYFWTFAHTQFYGEPERLAAAGLMEEIREETGRRRRVFSVTPRGREALESWLADPRAEPRELRDVGMLKLFFAELAEPVDVERLESDQLNIHRTQLQEMERLESRFGQRSDLGYRPRTITWGRVVETALVKFWRGLGVDPAKHRGRVRRRSRGCGTLPGEKLSPMSYIALGLVELRGPSTPYDLKQAIDQSIGYFWTFSHAQFYNEPARLVGMGLMNEMREEVGRRKRTFSITPEGSKALCAWLAQPTEQKHELRDPGMLKLFFAELVQPEHVERLRESQLERHQRMIAELQDLQQRFGSRTDLGYRPDTIRWGLAIERSLAAFWQRLEVAPTRPRRPSRVRRRAAG